MGDDNRIRSFVAVDVTAQVRAALTVVVEELKEVRADIRWMRPEAMHATLKFLGGVDRPRLERVRAAVEAAAGARPAMQLRTARLGAFPSWRRARVLWAGLHGAGLTELAADFDAALVPLGFAAEQRAFTPHITLGRVRSQRGWPDVERAAKPHLEDDFGSSDVACVTIYRTTLRPEGSVYTPLWTIPLTGNKEALHDIRR